MPRHAARRPSSEREAVPTVNTRPTTLRELRPVAMSTGPSRPRSGRTSSPACAPASRGSPASSGSTRPCCPHLERALLAGHDLVLLGERGQGKTRLIRTLGGLLDEWTPVVDGCEINDHPYAPVCVRCRRLARRAGRRPAGRLEAPRRAVRREARHPRHQRRRPDRRRRPGQGRRGPHARATRRPSTTAWCPAPTAASSASTSCPTWPSASRSSLLNVLEERDIQVRGYALRLPLDVLLVASANPEDYTNRGRIITPLKDRFGAEIRTHYPLRRSTTSWR